MWLFPGCFTGNTTPLLPQAPPKWWEALQGMQVQVMGSLASSSLQDLPLTSAGDSAPGRQIDLSFVSLRPSFQNKSARFYGLMLKTNLCYKLWHWLLFTNHLWTSVALGQVSCYFWLWVKSVVTSDFSKGKKSHPSLGNSFACAYLAPGEPCKRCAPVRMCSASDRDPQAPKKAKCSYGLLISCKCKEPIIMYGQLYSRHKHCLAWVLL